MVKISKQLLPEYITYPTSDELHFDDLTQVYDVVSRNSDTLLITVGDSWSYGLELPDRTNQVYGNLVAENIAADWLNISLPGQGNFWITARVEEIMQLIKILDYRKIYIICMFTEIGRSMISHLDGFVKYRSWLAGYTGQEIYQDFLKFINESCVDRIVELTSTDPRVTLHIGTTWPDALGLSNEHCFKVTWLDVIRLANDLPLDHVCYSAMHGLDHLKRAQSFFPNAADFLEWYNDMISVATQRLDFMHQHPEHFKNCHTRPLGHRIWADYVINCLQESQ